MSGWQPLHHMEADDPDGEPAKGVRTGSKPRSGKKDTQEAPVGLSLSLPPDFVSAVWANSDQVLRLAIAVEENTKATTKLMEALTKAPETSTSEK